VKLKTAAELSGIFQSVLFCPEDLYLIREGAAARRKYLEDCICQLRPRYAQALAEYKRLHEHKTRILRDSDEKPSLLDTLDEFSLGMAKAGALLIYYRAFFIKRLQETAPLIHKDFSGRRETLALRYATVSTVTDPEAGPQAIFQQLLSHQEAHRAAEIASRQCLSGPHKDDLIVEIDGNPARTYSSQGQTRTAALSLKLAAREIFQHDTGEYPVLLLDDVLSELDPRRQEFVLNRIKGGQVFITCCEDDRLERLLGGKVLHVENGKIR
jgi:DNA replication and repair protein RecF